MGKEDADPTKSVLEWQCLALKLHPMVTKDMRSDIGLSRQLDIRVPELENNLRLA